LSDILSDIDIERIQDNIDYLGCSYSSEIVDIERMEPLLSIGCHSNQDIEEMITDR